MVLHITGQRVQHAGMALDERPVRVAEMMEELQARHRGIAPAGDHHLQHVPTPLMRRALERFWFEHDLFAKPVSTFPDHALGGRVKQRGGSPHDHLPEPDQAGIVLLVVVPLDDFGERRKGNRRREHTDRQRARE